MTILKTLRRESSRRDRKVRKIENQLDALQERAMKMLAEQQQKLRKM